MITWFDYIYMYIYIYKHIYNNNFFRKGKRVTTNLRLLVSRYLVHQVNS